MTPHEALLAERVLTLARVLVLQRQMVRATEQALQQLTRELEAAVEAPQPQAVH